jgi:hypothetical protein
MKTHTHKMHSTITKADASAEEVMKGYTGKYNARRILFIFPILAILLTVSPIPAQAGVIDTVNNKVTTILNKVKSIASNTSGLQEFITTLRDIRDSMGGGMISDMRETLGETQDLMQFIKDRRESAGDTSQYPSLHVLVQSLDGTADVLLDRNGQGGVLEGLSALLAVLPDKVLAPVARAVSRVGIDNDFVATIDRMATDLVELRDITAEADAGQDSASQDAANNLSVGVDALYVAQFGCHISKLQLVTLNRTTKRVKTGGQRLKLVGALTQAKDEGIKLKKGAGVWGWVSVSPEAKPQWVIGKVLEIIGDAALNLVGRAEKHIDTCKAHYEKAA